MTGFMESCFLCQFVAKKQDNPVWIVEIKMPRRYVDEFSREQVEAAEDSYVDLVPLKEVIHQGARVLDFALYLVNGDVVVGAGPTDSDNIKGTYNQVPVTGPDGILSTINSYAFQAPCPNPNDPLFIHFRILLFSATNKHKSTTNKSSFWLHETKQLLNSSKINTSTKDITM